MKIQFSGALYRFVDYAKQVEVEGPTLGECVDKLVEQYPRLESALLDQSGRISNTHQLFLNGKQLEPAPPAGLDPRLELGVASEDTLYVLTAITGG